MCPQAALPTTQSQEIFILEVPAGVMTWSGVGAHEFYRWWSVNKVVAAGKYELAAPLVPDQWFSVFGKRGDHPAAAGQFVAAVADLHAVGQTFGGMFAGHGAFAVDGPSRFTLESYEIA